MKQLKKQDISDPALDELVLLVDEHDIITGTATKWHAHTDGLRHRAFSVIVVNPDGEILLQQRAMNKYHSRGLWTNTCCSHPRISEDIARAAKRRLDEEMGFICDMTHVKTLDYRTPPLDTGLIEHEMLHLFVGVIDPNITKATPDPTEVMATKWVTLEALRQDVAKNPEAYSYWFQVYLRDLPLDEILSRVLAKAGHDLPKAAAC